MLSGSAGRSEQAAPANRNRASGSAPARIARFTVARYETHHLLYAVLFVAAVEGTAAVVSHPDAAWRPGWATAVRVAVVAVLLLYLRMVDEIKDLDYDRVHNPDRPLVTGAVGVGELWAAIGVIAVALTVVSALLSWWSAALVVAAMAYGLALWGLESVSARVRGDLLLNLAVTYPVQLWIIAYLVGSAIDTGQVESGWRTAWVAPIFAGAFLHFEFARKTAAEVRPGQWYYSNVLGVRGSVVATVGFAALAVGTDVVLSRPWDHPLPWALLLWIPVGLLLLPALVAGSFLTRASVQPSPPAPARAGPASPGESGGESDTTTRAYPVIPAVVFVLVLYLILIATAAAWR
ncbi:hypothetical protein C5E45_29920 [Nocardia nova]|uniref:Ubiquinone biosynthesis protein UbiA n=1 Tax=Nocardia nova TaxID=37330 RepID=A0A2S6AH90_9NOCA|nr:hypothetical protein [Nocardia nova]PPJ31513.1 hypothetical protein C5E41_06145 [Nocardia nova]PPJ34584.1 hypothetical protein C5E45_29920 [Nocardia nova]